ncbi:MAG TPA: helix-turn-helix domain-containing protein [Roseiflexaceae bacterium]|nr:helix-turn-helix domain-containing protein [Roseiflexaceae bacterium]
MGKRRRQAAPETWTQLELLTTSPEQRAYELIRPIVLFGQSPAARAEETGVPTRQLRQQAARFEAQGMQSLFSEMPAPPAAPLLPQALPDDLRQRIRALKSEHSALRIHEIATICYACTGRRPHALTIKRVLEEAPIPERRERRFLPYHQIADPTQRRVAILRLHVEGWTKQSIAEYLETSRETVHATLRRYVTEGVAGLYPRSRAPKRPVRKVTLKTILLVRTAQRNPKLGAFRIQSRLKQLGISLSLRTCGRILAMNRKLYAKLRDEAPEHTPKPMPFATSEPHAIWTVDIRYLDMHQLGGGNIYCITILDNASRAVLASALTRSQDLSAYLLVLYAAIRQHGTPGQLVSDRGGVFLAKHAQDIYKALLVTKKEIDRHQSWQSYIETQFNVQRRMADWHFERATTWQELVAAHDAWVADFNYQAHWAHRERGDNRHSPVEVMGEAHGRLVSVTLLQRVFDTSRFARHVDQAGYLRFRHWRVYAETGLAGREVALWLTTEDITITYADQALAHYHVQTNAEQQIVQISEPQVVETSFQPPQLPLWSEGEAERQTIIPPLWYRPPAFWSGSAAEWLRLVPKAPQRRGKPSEQSTQLPLAFTG